MVVNGGIEYRVCTGLDWIELYWTGLNEISAKREERKGKMECRRNSRFCNTRKEEDEFKGGKS